MKIEVIDSTQIPDTQEDNPWLSIQVTKISLPELEHKTLTYFGFDPGTVNFGLAQIFPISEKMFANLYEIRLAREDDAVQRMLNIRTLLSSLSFSYHWKSIAIIEGAAFSKGYRQVELAEQRASIALWCHTRGMKTQIVNPKTVRKHAFGSGNTRNPWMETLKDNCVAALGCALYGYQL